MFEGELKAGVLTDALNAVGVLVEKSRVRFHSDGVELAAVEPANVTSMVASVDADAFDSFDADERTVGVDVSRLRSVTGAIDADETLRLETEDRTLRVKTGRVDYSMRLIDPGVLDERRSLDGVELPARATLARRSFDRMLAVTAEVSDAVTLGVHGTERTFYASAEEEYDDVRVEFDADELLAVEPHAARSLFSVEYLQSIDGAVPHGAPITVRLGEQSPAELSYEFAGGNGTTTYHVAPKRHV